MAWDRILAAISSTILLIAVVSAFFAAPLSQSSAYLQFITRIGSESSLFTKDFALASLGNYGDGFFAFPKRALWAWCLWLLLLFWPVAQTIWVIRAEDFEKSSGRLCLGMVEYLSVACALATLIIIGLIMPFQQSGDSGKARRNAGGRRYIYFLRNA